MSGNDPKDTDSVETGTARGTSRRDFLTAGAAATAVVGAAAAVMAPKQVQAAGKGQGKGKGVSDSGAEPVDTVIYHPNEGLAKIIVRGWLNETWLTTKLLSFPAGSPEWPGGKSQQDAIYERVRDAMFAFDLGGADEEIFGLHFERPVVLTLHQYQKGYQTLHDDEMIFVFPPFPKSSLPSNASMIGETARALMAVVPFGM